MGLGCHLVKMRLTQAQFIVMKLVLSRMAGNVASIQTAEHITWTTSTVLPPGTVLHLHRNISIHRQLVPHPTRHNLLVPVGFMPMSLYRMDGRSAVLLKGGRILWTIVQGPPHGTTRDLPRSPLQLHLRPRPHLLLLAHSHLDGKCG